MKMQMRNACIRAPKRVVLADAQKYKVLKAAEIVWNEKLAYPILLGNEEVIRKIIAENELELSGVEIIDNKADNQKERRHEFAEILFKKQQRNGVTLTSALDLMTHRHYFGPMLVETGYADSVLLGLTRNYPDSIKSAIQVIGKRDDCRTVSAMYIINTKEGPYFLSDCAVNEKPSKEELIDIILETIDEVRRFKIEPRIAMLSYSNFGSNRSKTNDMIQEVVEYMHVNYPEVIIDGEMQANVAINDEMREEFFPFSTLNGLKANTLIFPNLQAANISQKLLVELSDAEGIGPILNGMKKPAQVLRMGAGVKEIADMIMVAVLDAAKKKEK
jgi:malate dehydrogenase (oxaloacetate-decarboxylating)(NADP+)